MCRLLQVCFLPLKSYKQANDTAGSEDLARRSHSLFDLQWHADRLVTFRWLSNLQRSSARRDISPTVTSLCLELGMCCTDRAVDAEQDPLACRADKAAMHTCSNPLAVS